VAPVEDREELIEEIGGIRIGQRRVPGWLMLVVVAVVVWGLYYLIKYSITDTGTFKVPAGAALLRR